MQDKKYLSDLYLLTLVMVIAFSLSGSFDSLASNNIKDSHTLIYRELN